MSARLSSEPPGGRPRARLKAGTPREASTLAPTMKTPSPTTANRRSTRAKASRRAPTFKLLAWREELCRPWSPASTPRFDVPPEQRSWRQERTTSCDLTHDPRSLSEETKAPQRPQLVPPATRHDMAEEACHTLVGYESSGGARCRAEPVGGEGRLTTQWLAALRARCKSLELLYWDS